MRSTFNSIRRLTLLMSLASIMLTAITISPVAAKKEAATEAAAEGAKKDDKASKTVEDKDKKQVTAKDLSKDLKAKPSNSMDAPQKRPDKTRAPMGYLVYNNMTGWYLDMYLDGVYQGQVGPYRAFTIQAYLGRRQLDAVADFGSKAYRWGPRYINLGTGDEWTWSIK